VQFGWRCAKGWRSEWRRMGVVGGVLCIYAIYLDSIDNKLIYVRTGNIIIQVNKRLYKSNHIIQNVNVIVLNSSQNSFSVEVVLKIKYAK
jgi:hypothetical protein